MPATSITARASKSTRSAEIASHFASHEVATRCFPEHEAVCSDPISPITAVCRGSHRFAPFGVFGRVAAIQANRCGRLRLLTAHKCAHSFRRPQFDDVERVERREGVADRHDRTRSWIPVDRAVDGRPGIAGEDMRDCIPLAAVPELERIVQEAVGLHDGSDRQPVSGGPPARRKATASASARSCPGRDRPTRPPGHRPLRATRWRSPRPKGGCRSSGCWPRARSCGGPPAPAAAPCRHAPRHSGRRSCRRARACRRDAAAFRVAGSRPRS